MKSFLFLIIPLLSCIGNIHHVTVEITTYNNDTITLHSESNAPLSFYYIPSLKGIPLIFTKGSTIKIISKNPIYLMETSALQIPYIVSARKLRIFSFAW